jgi:hypothetical protein
MCCLETYFGTMELDVVKRVHHLMCNVSRQFHEQVRLEIIT